MGTYDPHPNDKSLSDHERDGRYVSKWDGTLRDSYGNEVKPSSYSNDSYKWNGNGFDQQKKS